MSITKEEIDRAFELAGKVTKCEACDEFGLIEYDSCGEGLFWLCGLMDEDHLSCCGTTTGRVKSDSSYRLIQYVRELESDKDGILEGVDELNEALMDKTALMRARNEKILRQNSKIDNLNAKISNLEAKVTELDTRCESSHTDNEYFALQHENNNFRDKISKLELEVKEAREVIGFYAADEITSTAIDLDFYDVNENGDLGWTGGKRARAHMTKFSGGKK